VSDVGVIDVSAASVVSVFVPDDIAALDICIVSAMRDFGLQLEQINISDNRLIFSMSSNKIQNMIIKYIEKTDSTLKS
jgi:hypothetical protein